MRRPGIIQPSFSPRKQRKGLRKGFGQIPGPSIPFTQVGRLPTDKKFAMLTASRDLPSGLFPSY